MNTLESKLNPRDAQFQANADAMRARPDSGAWWVVNPDTLPEPDALSALVERLSRGDCHMVGGVLYNAAGRVQAYGGHWRYWLGRVQRAHPAAEELREGDLRLAHLRPSIRC